MLEDRIILTFHDEINGMRVTGASDVGSGTDIFSGGLSSQLLQDERLVAHNDTGRHVVS